MHEFLITTTSILAIGYGIYFLWYLRWPVVEGVVVSSRLQDVRSVVVSRWQLRSVVYRFEYRGQSYNVDRQGLFTRYGFAPSAQAGDRVPISICPFNIRWSCPTRTLFNTLMLMCIQTFLFLAIFTFLSS